MRQPMWCFIGETMTVAPPPPVGTLMSRLPMHRSNTLHTSITGLTSGKTYYFRTFASNVVGSDWSDSTTGFTTITSSFREDDIIRYSDLKGWWKMD